ncbi:hypothetical protein N7U49_46240 [Streptomyces sp. AD2-2]|nr:hypothetical protein N7U49_46240 [Streptomyces sp. AD2-2]
MLLHDLWTKEGRDVDDAWTPRAWSRHRTSPTSYGSRSPVRGPRAGARYRHRMSAARCYDEQGNPLTRYVMDACGVSRTLVVRVRGRGSGRVSMAGMTCYRLGEQPRPICAIREYRVRKASRRASAGGTSATRSSAPASGSAGRSCWSVTTCGST